MGMSTKTYSILFAFTTIFLINCTGRGNVDLSKATPLTAEPVKTPPTGGVPGSSGDNTQYNGLFNLQPGQWVSFKALGGVVDPVGTVLAQDFDGDGIANDKETTSNMWVADYPVVEAEIAPPVTLKIELLKTSTSETATIDTNLSSDNFESRKGEGSEKFHQDEVNLRTINNGTDTHTGTTTNTFDFKLNVKAKLGTDLMGLVKGDIDTDTTLSTSNTETSTNSTVRQTFEDRPFKNNIDRAALSTKSDTSEKKARDYRREKRAKVADEFTTKSDAGIVRAALYIKNHSVNMPVKLSNILCSLVFETPSGALLPIQSFRLRNDDFSLFEVEIYGNSEFGPYVVELKNLNTVEIENAIAQGYTPKIYIVDYKMTHVQDSNYRLALSSSFTGDNLKIIEENAKGRTALLKLIYPGFRNMFRVTAFDTQLISTGTDICKPSHIDTSSNSLVSPGISMVKLLERLRCSGIDIQFGHYIYDFTGTELASKYPKIYLYTIKSVNGVGASVPCSSLESGTGYLPATNSYGAVSNVCLIKIKDLTDIQLDNLRIWATFDNAKYYAATDLAKDGNGDIRTFDGISVANCGQPAQVCGIPVVKSVTSTVWAGDNYDVVYLRMSDFMGRRLNFGTNPFETGESLVVNTTWNNGDLGESPFDPNVKSDFLGKAGLGETIELIFNLKDTTFLNPNFGNDVDPSTNLAFTNFSYDRKKTTKKFSIEEALDFEINLGLGGGAPDWQNIMRPPSGAGAITRGPVTVDYLNQQFTVQVTLPSSHPLMAADGAVGIYLRPTLNNAYRNSIWPQDYLQVKKYDTKVHLDVATGTSLQIKSGIGNIGDVVVGTDNLKIVTDGTVYTYAIISISSPTAYGFNITLAGSGVSATHKSGDRAYVDAGLNAPQVSLNFDYIDTSNNFFADYNTLYPQQYLMPQNSGPACATSFQPTRCYGYLVSNAYDYVINNWIGGVGFANAWSDGSNLGASFANSYLMSSLFAYGVDWQRMMLRLVPGIFQNYNVSTDTPMSTSNTGQQFYPMSAASQGKALTVWQSTDNGSDEDIRGRITDMQTGVSVGTTDFRINDITAATQSYPAVGADNGKALVAWASYDSGSWKVRGRIIDLNSGNFDCTTDMLLGTSDINATNPIQVLVFGNSGLVIWRTGNVPYSDIMGRFVDMGNCSAVSTGDFNVSTANAADQYAPQLAGSNGKALVVWATMDSGDADIRGRAIDMVNMALVGASDFRINYLTNNTQSYPAVSVSGDKALVAWHSADSNVDYDIRGRVVDIVSGITLGSTDILISYTNNSHQVYPKVSLSGDRALVSWYSEAGAPVYTVYGRVVNIKALAAVGSSDFLLSTTNSAQNIAQTAMGSYVVVTWESNNSTPSYDIRGRVVDLDSASPVFGNDFLVSTTSTYNQRGPSVVFAGQKALVTWYSDVNGSYQNDIFSNLINFPSAKLPYGQNNFFTAPLIERNYTVTSRIKF